MNLKPRHNNVVIKKKDESEVKYGNIIVPDMGKEGALIGEVIAIGPGQIDPTTNNRIVIEDLKIGDIVAFPGFGGQKITVKGEEYLVYKETELSIILEN